MKGMIVVECQEWQSAGSASIKIRPNGLQQTITILRSDHQFALVGLLYLAVMVVSIFQGACGLPGQ